MTKFFLTSWAERPVPEHERAHGKKQLPEVQIDIGFALLRSGPNDDFQEAHKMEGMISLRSVETPNIGPYEREGWVRSLLRKAVEETPQPPRLTSSQEPR